MWLPPHWSLLHWRCFTHCTGWQRFASTTSASTFLVQSPYLTQRLKWFSMSFFWLTLLYPRGFLHSAHCCSLACCLAGPGSILKSRAISAKHNCISICCNKWLNPWRECSWLKEEFSPQWKEENKSHSTNPSTKTFNWNGRKNLTKQWVNNNN